ncbi:MULTISPECIES: AIPR family protein [Paraburkholderia]|uniref:AIPR family protein n=1 Tax=Paraburkholderia TaxID=1822464 RepID=UPI00225A2C9E|nr:MULTISPECIES: AIPR family protein [Paraburkholderia]MCX4177495.1 AIPR family protein [Paraburkholderia madseniana]MDQ6465484.1 AIPR family protein [Paraburkholderia madseniana]
MELIDFLRETQAEVRTQIEGEQPYEESAFTEVLMRHMADIGMTYEPEAMHFSRKIGSANVRLSGYAVSDEQEQLDLFVSLYQGVDDLLQVSDSETKAAAEQCLRFLQLCAEGRLASKLDESDDVRILADIIHQIYDNLEQIRIYVLTDRVARTLQFKSREIGGKTVHLEVMDIARLHRHWSEGKPRDELVADFTKLCGNALPCVFVPGDGESYDYALTAVPGEALRVLYEQFGARLLEANVRSFLSVKARGVNAGIQTTLRQAPNQFMAFNNGIVVVADEMRIGDAGDGAPGIAWLKGLQIVNGGQTTASLYFTKRKYPDTDLSRVRVPAKIIVMKIQDTTQEEALVSDISRFANSQNSVRQSDLSANKPFHVQIERLSMTVYCPDGRSRWFYERTTGSYNTMLSREGTTAARLRELKETMPSSRRITKTDLSKYLTAWDRRPDIVSRGSQKNFEQFMATMSGLESEEVALPDVTEYKRMIAKTKLFRDTQKLMRTMFPAFQGNIAAYTFALIADRFGERIDLDRIWSAQGASRQLMDQIGRWAREVNELLDRTANGRMISEWAKKPECKDAILSAEYSPPDGSIPELQ